MASKKVLNSLDLVQNELQNARIQNLASAPSSPVAGQVYYDTTLNAFYSWNGTSWIAGGLIFGTVTAETTFGAGSSNGSAVTAPRSDHTHGNPVHDTAAHAAVALSGLAAPIANVAFNAKKITGLADPTLAQDAATKNYVDGLVQGLDIKADVKVATTVALTGTYVAGSAGADGGTGVGATFTMTATGVQVIDGITLLLGDRVLIKNQAAGLQNGIYTVTIVGSVSVATQFTRSTDYNDNIVGQIVVGTFNFVSEGTAQGSTSWVQTTKGTSTTPVDGIKLGTDALLYAQFSGAGTYSGSNGILLTGVNFTFVPLTNGGLQTAAGGASVLLPASSGLVTDATGLHIDTTVVVRKFAQTLSTSATAYTITHNLGTLDVQVVVYLVADGSEVIVDNLRATTNSVTLNFGTAPSASAYRVVILG